ncbi:hypothetical protein SK128_015451 [Halocaridina rubra]|uniref:Uncharacterized protein n=1 Tax=Halocaridina rubra TaxID=373956 RepID=A0AAN8ZYH2_HALRR
MTPSKVLFTTILASAAFLAHTASASDEDVQRMGRIFAYYSTTSVTKLTTTTITRLSTCLSSSASIVNCQGRKKRAVSTLIEADLDQVKENELTGSLEEDFNTDHIEKRDASSRSGRKLTIWSTNFTTITITSTSVLASTTVTATALCNYPGLTISCYV